MRDRYVKQLEQLRREMLNMGMLCEKTIVSTYQMLFAREHVKEAGEKILEMEEEIDRQEREIEGICLQLLLQQQPVASDLRFVSASLKMITDLERIGDQAADIAEIIMTGKAVISTEETDLTMMAQTAVNMVNKSVEAYIDQNLGIARETIGLDDEMDGLFLKVRSQLTGKIAQGEPDGGQMLDLLMIAKYYERIGDHAVNVAEWVEFAMTGKHRRKAEL